MLFGLIFELGHTAELSELGEAAQHPAQFRMLMHMTLDEQDVFLGVQAAGDVLRQLLQGAAAQGRGVLAHGDGVHIHDAVQAVIVVLQGDPVLDRAHIRTQGQIAAGLNSAQYPLFLVHRKHLARVFGLNPMYHITF